jgi:hypothetical protein
VPVNRRGLGLLEALIALSLTGVVAVLTWSILQSAAFRLRDRSERMAMEHSLRVAAQATRAALEPLGRDSTAGADLASIGPDGFVARAARGSGVVCAADATSLSVRAAPDWWSALRVPVAGRDSVMVGTVAEPARWVAADLLGPPGGGTCPDGMRALILPAALAPADLADIGPGSPIRVFEHMELRVYGSTGSDWLGERSVSSGGTIQPLAGPFTAAGLTFSFFSSGGGAALPGTTQSATWTGSGVTERAGGIGVARVPNARTDSAAGTVLLRNAP